MDNKLQYGDKLVCENWNTYTLREGTFKRMFYLEDRDGEIVSAIGKAHIRGCVFPRKNKRKKLKVGFKPDGMREFTMVQRVIKQKI